jgi:putative transposase
MTDDRMALMEALQKADDRNFLRSLAETVLQILMEADVEGMIGAGRYERSGERSTWRNGYRDRTLDKGSARRAAWAWQVDGAIGSSRQIGSTP